MQLENFLAMGCDRFGPGIWGLAGGGFESLNAAHAMRLVTSRARLLQIPWNTCNLSDVVTYKRSCICYGREQCRHQSLPITVSPPRSRAAPAWALKLSARL